MQNVPAPSCWKEPSVPRIRQLKRALHNFLLTTACGLMTILVLKGKSGFESAPDQDLMQMRGQYEQPNLGRVMVEENETPRADADDRADDQELLLGRKVYSLDPKIFDWDQQREEWLRKRPSSGKPRILLVTGSQPFPCNTPLGSHYLLKSFKNKIDYCRLHNIEIFYNTAPSMDSELTGFWASLPIVRSLMLAHPEVEWFWWMDSDAMVTDMAFELPMERYESHDFVLHGWKELVQYTQKTWIELKTGSFLLRNCQWSLDIMEVWASMGLRLNDQSTLIYLIISQKSQRILVDQDKEIMRKHEPELGDDHWPFVTRSVGCKSCSSRSSNNLADNSMQECFKLMEVAYNFADNQNLKLYGFQHASLETSKLIKISHNKLS